MTAAIYYHPEAYTTSGPKLMGRNAAGESFLKGFLKHSKATEFWAQVQKPEHGQHFAKTVKDQGRHEAVKVVDKASMSALSQIGTVYYPGPGIGEHAAAGHLHADARPTPGRVDLPRRRKGLHGRVRDEAREVMAGEFPGDRLS